MAIGDRIRDFRMATSPKLTQEQLAEKAGITRSRLAQYESGRTEPPRSILKSIADVLGRTVQEIEDESTPVKTAKGPRSAIADSMPYESTRKKVDMVYAGEVPADSEWGDPLSSNEKRPVDAKFAVEGKRRFVAKIVGDSGYPYLQPGDQGIFEFDESPSYGLIILAERTEDHACTVKQIVWNPELGRSKLVVLNEAYEAPPERPGWKATAKLVGLEFVHEGADMTIYEPDGIRPRQLAWRGFAL